MLIKSVSLSNIKSYREATLDFQLGTNAISGVNGAGKSTILEAIGYALFDYRPYKIESMVRHGEKKGEIRVVFTGKDGRDYEIVRTIRKKGGTASYYIHDLRIGGNIADSKHHGKNGVLTALRKDILDIGPETDLQTLFEDVIGVPQGTIITPFLETAAQRKEKFDPILGIDEYKKAYERTGEIVRIIEKRRNELEKEDAATSGKLEVYPETIRELEHIREEKKNLQGSIDQKSAALRDVQKRESEQKKIEKDILLNESKSREWSVQRKSAVERQEELKSALKQATEAQTIVREAEPQYRAYIELEHTLQELEKKRTQRDVIGKEEQLLLRKEAGMQERLSSLEQELKHLSDELKRLPEVQRKLAAQKELEGRKQELEQEIVVRKERATRLRKLEKEREISQQNHEAILEQLKTRDELESRIRLKQEFEKAITELTEREVTLKNKIKHYQESRESLKSGGCPFFNEPCPNITGDATTLFLDDEKKLEAELKGVRRKIASIKVRLKDSLEAEKTFRNLQILVGRERSLRETMSRLEGEIDQLQVQISGAGEEKELKAIKKNLKEMGDNRGEYLSLVKFKEQKPAVEREFSEKQLSLVELRSSLKDVRRKLESYSGLDESRNRCDKKKSLHKKGYDDYRSYKKESEKVEGLSSRIGKTEEEITRLANDIKGVKDILQKLNRSFSKEELMGLTASFNTLNQELGSMKGVQSERERREKRLIQEIRKMEELKRKRGELEQQLEVEHRSENLMTYIRKIFKMTPEYLRKRYVAAISQDANNRFHELMGDNTVDISWNEEYGITMRKGKDTLEFKLLSGGQQMSAALAIRLALIRRFSGLKIAFFDEPTHNLDEERKDNLARAFYRITGFDQLFVISHDETFNTVIENTIGVRMVNGESVLDD